jgi:hypothetical protein
MYILFSGQLSDLGLKGIITFSLQETTGKILIHFQKREGSTYRLKLGQSNKDLLGFSLPGGVNIYFTNK